MITRETVRVADIEDNDLSVNFEDQATFERLKQALAENGLLELPVIRPKGGGKYTIVSGHHRIRAWSELGHETIDVTIWDPDKKMTAEEEFNLVNNMNTVRGEIHRTRLVSKVRERNLDPTKLDIFKFPATALFPTLQADAKAQLREAQRDKARLNQLKMDVSMEVAKAIYDGKDEAVICFAANNTLCAVLRFDCDRQVVRSLAHTLKEPLAAMIESVLERD